MTNLLGNNSNISTTLTNSSTSVLNNSTTTDESQNETMHLIIGISGAVIAIFLLFAMAILLDFRHQKKNPLEHKKHSRSKKKLFSFKTPVLDDTNVLTTNMCPTGSNNLEGNSNSSLPIII